MRFELKVYTSCITNSLLLFTWFTPKPGTLGPRPRKAGICSTCGPFEKNNFEENRFLSLNL